MANCRGCISSRKRSRTPNLPALFHPSSKRSFILQFAPRLVCERLDTARPDAGGRDHPGLTEMLSAGGMHYPQGFGRMSSANMVTHHDHNQAPMSGLDALAQGSQYALQQLHDSHLNPDDAFSQSQSAQDQNAGNKGSSNGAPVRRRISRACDQCNQLRTKCDGKTPCAHCVGMLTRPTRPWPAETPARTNAS